MTTNKPNVKRYNDMGSEQICPVNNMYESDDGDFVLYEDYKTLQAELEKMKQPVCSSEVEEALEELHDMIANLILAYTNEGDVIMESGTSAEEHLDILASLPVREPHTYRKQGDDE